MKKYLVAALTLWWLALLPTEIGAQRFGRYQTVKIETSAELTALVNGAATETLAEFADKKFKAENLAVTLIDLTDSGQLKGAHFRGDEKIYPASVVKMFYLVALHQRYQDGALKPSAALDRAERDMIIESYNEPTQYIVDALTETHNGEELPAPALARYGRKRDAVNRYFQALGYKNINVNQKTYSESLYGRERQWWNEGKNRNMLTTNTVAQLLAEIALGRAVSAAHSAQMLNLLKRDFSGAVKDPEDQAHGFTGIALQDYPTAKLWSKAGWTSTTRHDAAYIELANGRKFVVVTFTTDAANERLIIPGIARKIIRHFAGN